MNSVPLAYCALAASCSSLSTSFLSKNGLKPSLSNTSEPFFFVCPSTFCSVFTYIPSLVTMRYVPLGSSLPTTSPCSSTSTLPKMSSGHAMRPKSGGFLRSLRCTHPPRPPPPAPPCALAPPAPEPPAPPPPPCLAEDRSRLKNEPPEPRLKPPGLASARACDVTSSSAWPCSRRTALRMVKKLAFSRNEEGVGGRVVVVPMASVGDGVERSVSIWLEDEESGKTFWLTTR